MEEIEVEEFIKDEHLSGYDYMNHLYLVANINFENIVKIEIILKSHDQGWATGHGKWTWGQINILNKNNKEKKERIDIYTNSITSNEWKEYNYIIEDKKSLNNIKYQDRICLWIRSLYPGWKNYVKNAKIIIYGINKISNNKINFTKI